MMKNWQAKAFRQVVDFLPVVTIIVLGIIAYKCWVRSRPIDVVGATSVQIRPGGLFGDPPKIPEEDKPYLPSSQLTPGSIFKEATRQEICVPGYAKRVRHVPAEVKREVYRSYGILHHQPGSYEVDHLVSLELGGDNSATNLWPQSYHGPWNAHEKDKAEDATHKAVCAGRISLKDAQQQMARDWIVLYRQFVAEHP